MTSTISPQSTFGASVTRRELRTLAKRLARSERAELRAVARALDKALAGEAYSEPHHAAHEEFDPFRCARCTPDLWVVYAIGVAFPDARAADLDFLRGLQGLSPEDIELGLAAGRDEDCSPDITSAWLALRDEQHDDEMRVRVVVESGWSRVGAHWGRSWDGEEPPANATADAELLAELAAHHRREQEAFGALAADPQLIQEVRFGSDARKARAARRSTLRKEMDLSCLTR